jgi:hypothetical protein
MVAAVVGSGKIMEGCHFSKESGSVCPERFCWVRKEAIDSVGCGCDVVVIIFVDINNILL